MSDNPFKDKHALVTGGVGFIGSHVCRRLINMGARVTAIDSLIPEYGGNLNNVKDLTENFHLNISDVRDRHAMKFLVQDADFLFNMAGQTSHLDSMENPYQDLEINTRAQLYILEACKNFNRDIRVVFASTRQLYGAPQYLPVDEKHPINPVDVNGINKYSGECYHLLYSKIYGIRSTALRLTNTFGPGMRVKDARQTFLGIWVKQALSGEVIKIFGTGEQKRDFNYVEDVVDALMMSIVSDEMVDKVYNLGSSEVVDLNDLAAMITELVPEAKSEVVPFPSDLKKIDIGDYYSDFTAIHEAIDWTPKTSLKSALQKTLDYYRESLDDYL